MVSFGVLGWFAILLIPILSYLMASLAFCRNRTLIASDFAHPSASSSKLFVFPSEHNFRVLEYWIDTILSVICFIVRLRFIDGLWVLLTALREFDVWYFDHIVKPICPIYNYVSPYKKIATCGQGGLLTVGIFVFTNLSEEYPWKNALCK